MRIDEEKSTNDKTNSDDDDGVFSLLFENIYSARLYQRRALTSPAFIS